jgi:hypothetical protein
MQEESLTTDYLVVGSGAVGMAFGDVILKESDANIIFVDLHDRPGGHWNDAYPFVRLHQPSANYGVNSRALGHGTKDATGLNAGQDELASGAEILNYFEQTMRQQFLPTGRVAYHPRCRYECRDGEHTFTSLVSGRRQHVAVRRKLVDTRYFDVQVPSTHQRPYGIAPGLCCVPLNELPDIAQPASGFVVIGAGKTGIDACLWLLSRGVEPDNIRWIMPRDAWLLNRAQFQSGQPVMAMRSTVEQMEVAATATSFADLFARLEAGGHLLRLDPGIEPTLYRCATVTRPELEQLRRIRNVVRLGRVQRIEPGRIVLEQGGVPADPGWLYVDCSARAFRNRDVPPIFDGGTIMPQVVRTCTSTFSAALVAHVELACGNDSEKNAMCAPVPLPEHPLDWLRMALVAMANQGRWGRDSGIRAWLASSRLNHLGGEGAAADEAEMQSLRQRYRECAGPAVVRMNELLASRAA